MIKPARLSGGIHPPSKKNTHESPTISLNRFATVRIPMILHNGPPSTCLVKPGETVAIGQLIGRADSPMAVPVHSSVSGKVKSTGQEVSYYGQLMTVVTIECDGLDTVHEGIRPPAINNRDEFIQAVRDSGLVGLGGAGFPTYIKMKPPAGKEPDILVINGAECEPYVTSDCRLCIEKPAEIIAGIKLTMEHISIKKAVIGIEANKPEAIAALRRELASMETPTIELKVVPTVYPQGAEKMLVYSLTGRKIPSGGLPHDVGVMVLNVNTVRSIADYLTTGMPLIRRTVTLDGGAVRQPGNYDVPVGVTIADLVEAAGGLHDEPGKVLMGGPMMGVALDRLNASILKINNAILLFDKQEALVPEESACIRCARCVTNCPMNLMPTELDRSSRELDVDALRAYHVMDCIECGSCTYVCPAKRFLVQSIRNGKAAVRMADGKAAAQAVKKEATQK